MLDGKKTKIGAALLAIWGVAGLLLGQLKPQTAWQLILGALTAYGIYDKVDRSTEE